MAEKKNTVLFVDDEIHILSSIRRATMDESFEALFASSGQEALQIFEKKEISVIVTDMRMPGMDGLALLKIVKEKYPQTVRIVLSGYTQLSQVLATVNQADIFQFIPKPWNMEEELLAGVRQGIKQFNIALERDRLRERLAQKNQAYQNIFRELEQKFINEKKDLANLKKIHQWIFAFWRKNLDFGAKYLEENKVSIADYTKIIEAIMQKYLDILPTNIETKSLRTTIDKIVKACSERVVVQPVHNNDVKISGYHTFLVMTLQILLELFTIEPEEKIICNMKLDTESGNASLIAIRVQPTETPQSSRVVQNRLKMGCSLLSEIGKAYRTLVKPELVNGEIGAVQIIWQSMGEMETVK